MKLTVVRILLAAAVVALGLWLYRFLVQHRPRPKEMPPAEDVVRVRAVRVKPEDVRISLTGHGTARPRRIVAVAPEVSGRVVSMHELLRAGNLIPAGEVILRIDSESYRLQLDLAESDIARLEADIAKTRQSQKNDEERLELVKRAVELARNDFRRAKELAEKEAATEADRDMAESLLVAREEQLVSLRSALSMYPIHLQELNALLDSAKAKRDLAKLNLDKTTLRCPFEARVVSVTVEAEQVVAPGQPVTVLADDSVLEISVPIDSRQFQRWFPMAGGEAGGKDAWYSQLPNLEARVTWVESPESHVWNGRLVRVERLDPLSRMIHVVVEVPAAKALSAGQGYMPLADGMFCKVDMPGRVAEGVVRLPRSAVSYEGTVAVSEDGRLCTRPIQVARYEGDEALISGGLQEGDVVVTTRIISPVEGMKLDVQLAGQDNE